ncbi:MAG: hypothetical protein AAGA30_12810 [Planctomycetota bacterium]
METEIAYRNHPKLQSKFERAEVGNRLLGKLFRMQLKDDEETMKKLCKEKLKSLGVDRLANLLNEIANKDSTVEK